MAMLNNQMVTWILSNFHTIHGVFCFLLGRIQDSVNKDDGGWRVEQLELLPSGIGHPKLGILCTPASPQKGNKLKAKRVEMTESQGAGFEPDPVPKPSEFQSGFVAVHGGWACDAQDCLEIWKCHSVTILPLFWSQLFMTTMPKCQNSWLFSDYSVTWVAHCSPAWSPVRPPGCFLRCDTRPRQRVQRVQRGPRFLATRDHNSFHSLGTSCWPWV